MIFDKNFLEELLQQAAVAPRLRVNHDLRNSAADTSQRMLNALAVGTEVSVHRHEDTAETVVCLCGKLVEIIYEQVDGCFVEQQRVLLCPAEGLHGMQVPAGAWHTIEVLEPSVIFEAKDGAYKG